MTRVLVTRPAEQAAPTIERLAALGHDALIAPLFRLEARPWTPPGGEFGATLLTSAATPTFAGPDLRRYRGLPCYCIGARTAAAAAVAGFSEVVTPAAANAAALLAVMAAAGVRRAFHPGGRDLAPTRVPPGIEIVRRTVYASVETVWSAAERRTAGEAELALVYSPRAGAALASALDERQRARLSIAAISGAAATAAGRGWRSVRVAARPDEAALFAAAGLVCDKQLRGEGETSADTTADTRDA